MRPENSLQRGQKLSQQDSIPSLVGAVCSRASSKIPIICRTLLMRLPIGIWDKTLWGKGYGKEVVRCLMAHAFGKLGIDRFCPVDVRADNARSKALWQSLGFVVSRELDDGKTLDFEITRAEYEKIDQRDS